MPVQAPSWPAIRSRVGISFSRSCEAIAAQFGILLSGAGWLPLDPAYPLERLQRDMTVAAQHYMIGDSAYEALGQSRLGVSSKILE